MWDSAHIPSLVHTLALFWSDGFAVHAQEWAIAKGETSTELNVYDFNQTVISFYERLGYQAFSRRMSKELKPEE